MANEGIAEVALQGLADEAEYCTYQGRSKPIFARNSSICCDRHPVGAVAEDDLGGIAGEKHHAEGDDADAEHDDDRLQQAADDVAHF